MDKQASRKEKTVDEFGRILIPKSIRKQFDLKPGDTLCYEVDADRIILRRPVEKCIFCNSSESVHTVMGRPICDVCKNKLKEQE